MQRVVGIPSVYGGEDVKSFGKHKGMPVAELPADYRGWLLRQEDVDPYLVKALKASASAPAPKISRIFSMR